VQKELCIKAPLPLLGTTAVPAAVIERADNLTVLVRDSKDMKARYIVDEPALEIDLLESLGQPASWWNERFAVLPANRQLNVCFCMPLGGCKVECDDDNPMVGLGSSFLSPLEMVKALDQRKSRVQITFVTCGAASVQHDNNTLLRSSSSLSQCLAAGLARCLHSEYPSWSVCWMDVGADPRRCPTPKELLVARSVLLNENGPASSFGDELAVRGRYEQSSDNRRAPVSPYSIS